MKDVKPKNIIISIVDSDYPDNYTEFINDEDLLKDLIESARKNGLYYFLLNELWKREVIEFQDNFIKNEISDLTKTIKLLNEASKDSGIDYILIKDYNTIPNIPRDVDIFVRFDEKDSFIKALLKKGFILEHSGSIETSLSNTSGLPLDVYTKIIYFDNDFLDEDFLFDSIKEREIFGTTYYGLKNESEYMLTILHGLFGHRRLTMLDFLHLKNIRKNNLDIEQCKKYAKNRNWEKVFILTLKKFESIYEEIYIEKKNFIFPYIFDIKFILKCVDKIEGLKLSSMDKFLIILSLLIDDLKLKVENSIFYDLIKRCAPLRKALLSIAYASRRIRRDKYS